MKFRFGHVEFLPGIELWSSGLPELPGYLKERIDEGISTFIVTLNPLMVMRYRQDEEFAKAINAADVIVADGVGIKWAYSRLTKMKIQLIPGVELAEAIIEKASECGWDVGLVGGEPGIWEESAEKLILKYPELNVVYGHHGFFSLEDETEIVNEIVEKNLHVLIAGMGFPRQEMFLHKYKKHFKGAVLIGAGGSLDVFSGKTKRAPEIFRRLRIEWVYRMIKEPKRIISFFILFKYWILVVLRHPSLFKEMIDDKIP